MIASCGSAGAAEAAAALSVAVAGAALGEAGGMRVVPGLNPESDATEERADGLA